MSEMSYAEGLVMELIGRATKIVWDAEDGKDVASRIDDFMTELSGARALFEQTHAEDILTNRSVDGVKRAIGWLRMNSARITNPPNTTTIVSSSKSDSKATASVDFDVLAVQGVPGMTEKERDELELELRRAKEAAEKGDRTGFADKVKSALDIASRFAGAIPVVTKAAESLSAAL